MHFNLPVFILVLLAIHLLFACFYHLFFKQERGFLPLSAALLSSSILRSETGRAVDLLADIVLHVEAIILSLLFCRSGLMSVRLLYYIPRVSKIPQGLCRLGAC